ncbi:hypothetical protein PanWU01x14_341980, partial [Parasponia andersonii]
MFWEIISTKYCFDSASSLPSFRVNSALKHSFKSIATRLMAGLLVEVFETQAIDISIVFQTIFVFIKRLSNLGSRIFSISPLASFELTQRIIWLFSSAFVNTGRAVINSNKTTPKLKTSLFSFSQF